MYDIINFRKYKKRLSEEEMKKVKNELIRS